MKTTCQECGTIFYGRKCSCGWMSSSAIQSSGPRLCAWHTQGRRCGLLGSFIDGFIADEHVKNKTYPDVYCGFHYGCKQGHMMSNDSDSFREWIYKANPEMSLGRIFYLWNLANGIVGENPDPIKKLVCWDEKDEIMVKGLAILGKNSNAWKHAPEAMRQAANNLLHASSDMGSIIKQTIIQ